MVGILGTEQGVRTEGAFVLEFFVGDDDERSVRARRAIALKLVKKLGEGSFEGVGFEGGVCIQGGSVAFLISAHTAGAS